jgi:hypothetical protein
VDPIIRKAAIHQSCSMGDGNCKEDEARSLSLTLVITVTPKVGTSCRRNLQKTEESASRNDWYFANFPGAPSKMAADPVSFHGDHSSMDRGSPRCDAIGG